MIAQASSLNLWIKAVCYFYYTGNLSWLSHITICLFNAFKWVLQCKYIYIVLQCLQWYHSMFIRAQNRSSPFKTTGSISITPSTVSASLFLLWCMLAVTIQGQNHLLHWKVYFEMQNFLNRAMSSPLPRGMWCPHYQLQPMFLWV